jgi:hypothetical protein
MSLDYNFSDAPHAEEMESEEQWGLTEAIIFITIPIGMPRIEEKTVEEFFRRVAAWEMATGAICVEHGDDGPKSRYTTLDDIRLRVGLRTNASPKTKHQFLKTIGETCYRHGQAKLSSVLREEAEEKDEVPV